MGKKLKIFSLLVVFFAFFLFPIPVKSACYVDAYGNCTGTCSCSTLPNFKCGTCECGYDENYFCMPWYTCHSCVTNTPAPQPTNTPYIPASPTDVPGGMQCSTTAQCYNAYCAPSLTPIPNCSSVCINGHCYTTHPGINPTITDVSCRSSNDYGPWSGCLSGQGACGGCAAWGYTCQVRYCIHPPTSNQYQISCGCTQPTSPPGNNGSTPTPTAFLRLRLLNPALSPVASSDITLCKVRCDTAPCSAVSCQSGVSLADFPGSILADRGGAIRDPNKLLTILDITPIQNSNVATGNSYPYCRGATVTDIKNCYTWSTSLTTGSRVLRYIVITNTPSPTSTPTLTPTPNPYWVKLKDTSFYTSRSLTQTLPSSPFHFDSDNDDAPDSHSSCPRHFAPRSAILFGRRPISSSQVTHQASNRLYNSIW